MTKDNSTLLENKRYDYCKNCSKIVVYDIEAIDREGNLIPLGIDGKRHHCNCTQRIIYEEKIVQEIQDDIARANKFELRYNLALVIPDEKATAPESSGVSSSAVCYKATIIEKQILDEVKANE
ncbi:MAG TPA: hypothetical protein VJ729_14835 [Nitrososphaeraceae archaeon]|nr:hypothetical protein [Nitrososphaeraceae archaeon]